MRSLCPSCRRGTKRDSGVRSGIKITRKPNMISVVVVWDESNDWVRLWD